MYWCLENFQRNLGEVARCISLTFMVESAEYEFRSVRCVGTIIIHVQVTLRALLSRSGQREIDTEHSGKHSLTPVLLKMSRLRRRGEGGV